MKKLFLFTFIILFSTSCIFSQDISDAKKISTEKTDNPTTVISSAAGREYILCLPENITKETALVIMLHGYGNNAESFRTTTQFDRQATVRGYAVVYANGIPDPEDKTSSSSWNSGLKKSSKNDVKYLETLAATLQKEYGFSTKRVFVAGFSNGAFMVHRLAVESKKFTAAASVAGFLPKNVWETRPGKIKCGFLQINGTKDDVVPMNLNGSAKYNVNPAIEDVIEYYKKACSRKAAESVKHIVIADGRHSWPEEKFCGFDVNKTILDFFDQFN